MDNIALDDIVSGAIDPEQLKREQEEAIAADASTIKESAAMLKQCADTTSDIIRAFCDILLTPDGQIKDISDKEGRSALRQELLTANKNIKAVSNAMNDLPSRLQKAVPSSVIAKLDCGDRKCLDKVLDFIGFIEHKIKSYSTYFVITLIIIGFIFGANVVTMVYTDYKSKSLDSQLKESVQLVEFGKFIRKNNPTTWARWQQEYADNAGE